MITLLTTLKCQLVSPACCSYLQSLEYLSFPHHLTLQRLYSNIGLDSEFAYYLRQSTLEFNPMERNVIVQMDQIHVKSEYTYNGGRIIASSIHSIEPDITVFAIMVSSLQKNCQLLFDFFLVQNHLPKKCFLSLKQLLVI